MRFFTHYLPLIAWAALIFTLSSIPSLRVTENFFVQTIINTIAHFVEYFVLTLLAARIFVVRRHYAAAGLSLLYAVSDEFHQSFVPGRVMDLKDLFVDLLGILFAVYLLTRVKSPHA